MPNLFEQVFTLDDDALQSFTDELGKKPEDQEAGKRIMSDTLAVEFLELAFTPLAKVPPAIYMAHAEAVRSVKESVSGNFDLKTRQRTTHNTLKLLLARHPPLQDLQHKLNDLFEKHKVNFLFSLLAMLNSIAKHLNRPRQLELEGLLPLPTEEEMKTQLLSLYTRNTQLHREVCQMLLQASMYQQQPHPKACTCMLCAHLAQVTASAPSTSQKAKPRVV